jgi:hypothetical protein
MTVPRGSRRHTFTASFMPWWAAAAIGEDGERTGEFRMKRLPSAFDPLPPLLIAIIDCPLPPRAVIPVYLSLNPWFEP